MNKSVLSMMMAVTIFAVASAQEKRFGIESVILKGSVISGQGEVVQTVLYIADYGRKESSEIFTNDGHFFALVTDDYVYRANLTLKQGSKISSENMKVHPNVNYLNLTNEDKEKYQIEEKGIEQFLGKECKRYEMPITVLGQTGKASILIWQGLTLKSTVTIAGNTTVSEVSEIQAGVEIAKEKFELPEGISWR